MNWQRTIPLAVLLSLLAFVPFAAAGEAEDATLHITERGGSYELSVPVSELIMSFPKGNFLQQEPPGAVQSPRYFMFSDPEQHLMMSGWFEPASGYSGFEQVWKGEKAAWRSGGLPPPENESRFKSGGWDAVAYDIALPDAARKQGIGNSHIRAFLVQAGTWIDVHVSVTSSGTRAERRDKLMALLKSIQVKQRP